MPGGLPALGPLIPPQQSPLNYWGVGGSIVLIEAYARRASSSRSPNSPSAESLDFFGGKGQYYLLEAYARRASSSRSPNTPSAESFELWERGRGGEGG
jgi:hypothetical protein